MPKVKVRIHKEAGTIDGQWHESLSSAQLEAQNVANQGFWDGNKFFPRDRVVYCELIEEKD